MPEALLLLPICTPWAWPHLLHLQGASSTGADRKPGVQPMHGSLSLPLLSPALYLSARRLGPLEH